LALDRALNGADLCKKGALYLEEGKAENLEIVCGKRIGVDYAGEYKDKPWRFYVKNNPFVSVKA
jgi:DNA-3-methyladenine glycosylase